MKLCLQITLIGLLLPVVLSQRASSLKCWQQLCKECPSTATREAIVEVDCSLDNSVTTDWLNEKDGSNITPNGPKIEYACLKMVSSNPDIIGDSTDMIRGCVPQVAAENICNHLVGVEQARNKKNVKCHICYSDRCNNAPSRASMGKIALFSILFIVKLLF